LGELNGVKNEDGRQRRGRKDRKKGEGASEEVESRGEGGRKEGRIRVRTKSFNLTWRGVSSSSLMLFKVLPHIVLGPTAVTKNVPEPFFTGQPAKKINKKVPQNKFFEKLRAEF
jgi:hypothetical protein